MSDVIEVGPLMIRGSLLIVVLSLIAGFIHLYIKLRKSSLQQVPITDLILNGILIIFVSWKLGPIAYEPSLLWKEPIKLLMVSGTVDIAVFGGVVAIAYWSVRLRKLGLSWLIMLDSLGYFIIGIALVYSLLTYHYGLAIVSAACIIILWAIKNVIGEGTASRNTFILLGLGGLIVSLFTSQEIVMLYLSIEQIIFILITLIGVVIRVQDSDRIEESQSTYTTHGKELSDMAGNRDGDSIAQQNQKKQNKSPQTKPGFDKKLDGPNRPAT